MIVQPKRPLKKNECHWVHKTFTEPGGPVYCGKKTNYKMVEDDGHNKVRRYSHLCDEHEKEAARLDEMSDPDENGL